MKNIRIKIKKIFIPYLIISIGTIFIYNALRWYLEVVFKIYFIREDILNFWIPFGLPWIPLLLFMRKRVHLLSIRNHNKNGYFFYYFAMTFSIAIPLIISQLYLEKNSFKLIEVTSVNQICELKNERFFKINSFNVKTNLTQSYATSQTSGKYGRRLNYYIFYASPFKNAQNVWYGVMFHNQMSNSKTKEEKIAFYNNFAVKVAKDFRYYDFKNVTYFKKIVNSFEKDGFLKAIKDKTLDTNKKEPIILVPQTDNFKQNINNMLFWTYTSFIIGTLLILLAILIPKVVK